jgi:hypothetical protein
MAGKAISSALVASLMLFGGAAGALASTPAAHAHVSKDKLVINITTTGGTVWGTVTAKYKSGSSTKTKTCAKTKCTWNLAINTKVKLSQAPTDSTTWPFKNWTVVKGRSTKTMTKATPTVKLTALKVSVTALYILAGSAQSSSNNNGGYGGSYMP